MQLLQNGKQQFIDQNGAPLANGSVYFYAPGTTNPMPTYQDPTGAAANTNPVLLDSRGQAVIWGHGTFRQVVKDAAGVTIWDQLTCDANAGITGNMVDQAFVAGTDFTPGTTTQLTLSNAPGTASNLWVDFDGVPQHEPSDFTLSGSVITFTSPIPVGIQNVYTKSGLSVAVGSPSAGSVTDQTVAAGAGISSSKLSFLQGGSGAIKRTVQDRLRETISVKDFGAKGDGTTDDTACIQNAINYAVSVGGVLKFPAGNYLVTGSGLKLDQSGVTDSDLKHVSIQGAGWGASQIYYTGSGTAFTYTGASPSALNSYFTMSDIRFLGTSAINGSIGIQLTLASGVVMRNVASRLFTTGMNGTDVLQSSFYDCLFAVNGGGVNLNYSAYSPPNAISFIDCEFIDNQNYAALVGNPSTVSFIGGAVQGNGLTGSATYRYGIAVIANNGTVGLSGALAAMFNGVYFENNAYKADIWFQAGNNIEGPTAITVIGCTFNRLTSAVNQFVSYNVLVDVNPPNAVKMTLVGNGFAGFGPYVPSSTTPYVFVNDGSNAPVDVVDYGNLYASSVERPVFLGPVKSDHFTVSAAATFDGTQASPTPTYSYNAPQITKTGTGVYRVTFQKAGLLSVYPVDVMVGSGVGYGTVNAMTPSNVTVNTFNASGVLTDFAYVSVKVFGNGLIS
jgi:hypothetical protein